MVYDKSGIIKSFSDAAPNYDLWAKPQLVIADYLVDFLPQKLDPATILEIGCGTGILTAKLRERFPEAIIRAIDIAPGMIDFCKQKWPNGVLADFEVADAEVFESPTPFDLVITSSSLQWFGDRTASLKRIVELTVRKGNAAFAVPIRGSLWELGESYLAAVGKSMPGLDFSDDESYSVELQRLGARLVKSEVESIQFWHKDPWNVPRSLKGIGATFGHHEDFAPLSGAQLRKLMKHYESEFSENGMVPKTYRVLFAVWGRS